MGTQLVPMLADYSKETAGLDKQPSNDDVDFLMSLCGKEGAYGKYSKITRSQVLSVCETWAEFLQHKEETSDLINKHVSDVIRVDVSELQDLLDELNGRAVPTEVTTWVFKQADIAQNGVLCEMELARALCAFEWWRNEERQNKRLSKGIKLDPELPPPVRSACCTVQ